MKISRIDVFQLDIPLEKPKRYPNRTYESLDDTIVRLETDAGIVGWGEVCPIASTYQPEHALGVRAAIEEMAPGLIGEDPTQTDRINATMNRWLMGGEYAKSAIDIACWDITGKAYHRPLYHLIGGRMQEKARAYPEIEMGPPEIVERRISQYREEGFRHFQVKAGRGSNFDLDIARMRKAGKFMTVDDAWGADLSAAAQAHMAVSTPETTFAATYVSSYFSNARYDEEAPMVVDGFLDTNDKSGLGVEPDMTILGEPLRTYG